MYISVFKRIIDLGFALTCLLILSPLLLIVTLVLYCNNRQPFFFQDRPGINAKPFRLIKFKTMNDNKDANGKLLSDAERISALGRLLRATSIDELPQLINVIKGDMSLVGPRPLLIKYISLYSPEQARRHNVKPGITGWSQVNGRNAISWKKKFELDIWYVDNLSFSLDLRILWLTIIKVFMRENINSATSATMPPFNGDN